MPLQKQERSFMRINKVTPSFKGFIYSPDDKVAVNTKYITSMHEEETWDGKNTIIFTTDKVYNKMNNVPLEQVLRAYSRASANETYYVNVNDFAKKDNDKKPYSI